MSLFDDMKFNKNLKTTSLYISYDEKKHPLLYFTNGHKDILLKRFFGQKQYERFLVECVLCHMYSNKAMLRKVHNAFDCINKFLESSDESINL